MMERTRQMVGAEPSRTLRLLPIAVVATDLVVVTFSGVLAALGRTHLEIFPNPYTVTTESLGWAGLIMILSWIAAIAAYGGYDRAVFGSGTDEYKRVARATFATAAAVGIGCYLMRFELSRGFFLIAFLVGLPALILGRLIVRQVLQNARSHGHLQVRVLMAGTPRHVDEVTAVLQGKPWLGYSVIGAVVPEAEATREETWAGLPIHGTFEHTVEIARDARADIIFFAGGSVETGEQMKEMVWELEEHDINVAIAPSLSDVSTERINVRPIGGLPLIHLDQPTWIHASRWGKRAFDLVGSAFLIFTLSPLLALIALRVRAADRGPVLFRQIRTGLHGETFSCLKFRTMVVDAEARLKDLHAQTGYSGGLFKMADDPRITKPGKWLRRFSLDELPQLFNVFRGEMSLVGPRPPLPKEVEQYDATAHRRLRVRPGMTGLWQVSGRSDLTWDEAIRLDVFYVDNWSMMQDLSILARTVGAVFGSRGAY